jgi:DNA polymerase-1
VNAPIQGTAADIIKKAMITMDRELMQRKMASRMLLQVHDELVFEVPKEELSTLKKLAVEVMSSAADTRIPLVVETGEGANWLEAH